MSLHSLSPAGSAASGTITGVVFQDFNSNGARDVNPVAGNDGAGNIGLASDRGVQGVSVTAFAASGAVVGSATSGADGSYSLTATGTGPYRIEFSNIPAGFQPGPHGAGVGSTVQFVPDGNSSNINLALVVPQEYCQNNPVLVTSCYVGGTQNVSSEVVVSFPYSAGTTRDGGPSPFSDYDAPAHGILARANQAGTTWGLSYSRSGSSLYAAAFMKKHTGFGPAGTGAIYKIDRANPANPVVTTFVNLNTIFGAGAAGNDPHNQSDFDRDNGDAAWDAVGKVSLGGLATSDDETKLYAMNLASRQLLEIPLNAVPTSANIRAKSVPANPPGCTSAPGGVDVRPFAVAYYQGKIYVGMVCSAESTISQSLPDGDASKLQAYVYSVDPVSLDFSASPVFQAPLNYPRRCTDSAELGPNNCFSAAWRAWSPVYKNIGTGGRAIYPQPWLTGIAFDRGNLILGLRDRAGDQFGVEALDNPADNNRYYGVTAGDLIRACGSPSTNWTLENNGRCGGIGSAPQNSGQGPGNGEYYFREDGPPFHDEVSTGGVLAIPGYPDVALTMFDPIPIFTPNTLFDGGIRWLNNTTGGYTKSYRVYDGERVFNGPFGKANGLGDLEPICDAAPIEIGNRIWRDLDGDGIQDANEPGIPGVTVRLCAPDGTTLATAVTDANGNYYFSSAAGANTASSIFGISGLKLNTTGYKIKLNNPADGAGNGPLANSNLSPADAGGNSQDQRDSDAMLMGGSPVVNVNTGGPGANNHTYDFGFVPAVQPPQQPTITCPINMTTTAASINGAVVTYPAPTATTGATVTCMPPSGSTFPIGTTTVTCTAANSAGSASCSFTVTITPQSSSQNADLAVVKTDNQTVYTPGDLIVYSITVTNKGPAAVANAKVVDKMPIALTNETWTCQITAQGSGPGTSACGASNGFGDINTTVSLRAGGVATYTLRARISSNATGNLINTATVTPPPGVTDPNPSNNTSTDTDVKKNTNPPPQGPLGPGTPLPGWSVLIFPVYTSNPANPGAENTRVNLTNTSATENACVHLFFVDGASCSVADANICLTPNQTASLLMSEIDPGVMGYIVAVAVDCVTGCPTNLNTLIGDEYVKFASGFEGNLKAECITAINLPPCDANAPSATLNFDGVAYSQLPRVLALDNIPSAQDDNSTLLVLDRIGGSLATGVGALGSIFGLLFNDTESAFSFTFIGSACQIKQTLSNTFPRTSPRFETVIPSGRSGWMKLWPTAEVAVVGAMFNRNPNAAASASAYNGAHGLHALRLQPNASLTIPIFPPS
ncbi:MAG: HYR domain-containing protein, partial [Verrucomicrobia subdivision 3 bacterium]|nr:HYR domain-containing protein [Limisphaerales bacterium]